MGRSKAAWKACQKAITHPLRSNYQSQPKKVTLGKMLPRIGFDWQRVSAHLDLHPDIVVRLQDALYAAYGRNISIPIFDKEMAKVILRGTEMHVSVTDTEPIEFWSLVKASFKGSRSFVENPRCTPHALHAFVAFAIEAREISIYSDTPNNPNAERNLAKVVTSLLNEFAHEPDAETRDQYYERAKEAHWVVKNHWELKDDAEGDDSEDNEIADEQDFVEEDSEEEDAEEEDAEEEEEEEDDKDEQEGEEQQSVEQMEEVQMKQDGEVTEKGEPMEGVEGEAERRQEDFMAIDHKMTNVYLDD